MEFLDETINIRVTPTDKEQIVKQANEERLSTSAYCRVKLVKHLLDND